MLRHSDATEVYFQPKHYLYRPDNASSKETESGQSQAAPW